MKIKDTGYPFECCGSCTHSTVIKHNGKISRKMVCWINPNVLDLIDYPMLHKCREYTEEPGYRDMWNSDLEVEDYEED